MDRPRFSDHLEAIKFICKDFWSELFKKQIDNLKTNHRVISRNERVNIYMTVVLSEFKQYPTLLVFIGYICIAR